MKSSAGGDSFLRQVALWGRVEDSGGQAVGGAQITIAKMPDAFSLRLRAFAERYGPGWKDAEGRPDQTRSKADGSFFFADLPPGEYAIVGEVRRIDRTQGRLEILRGESQGITIVWVDDGDSRMGGRKRIEMVKLGLVLKPAEGPELDPAQDGSVKAGRHGASAEDRRGNRK